MYFSWMVNSGTYYGLSLSASNLGGNPFYNYLILYVL
jgi:OCT family organic cation transporter-like MFS transporter 4/5